MTHEPGWSLPEPCADSSLFDRILRGQVEEADVIFVGTVLNIGAPGGGLSGLSVTYQYVDYFADEVLMGELPERRVRVHHISAVDTDTLTGPPKIDCVVYRTPNTYNLDPGIYAKGNRHVVFYRDIRADSGALIMREGYGIQLPTPEIIRNTEELARKKTPVTRN
jgi:hypothetical protein